ncbi:MAG: hypothetical protein K0S46_2114 [Moraxellaceae bacterium]|jgi:hypothetical protein|nr:hypothetical protein [Moraxellaceae bacterium]
MAICRLLVIAACLVAGNAYADDKWEVTTSMEMVGMPFQMPATKQVVCLAPGEQNSEKMVPADKNCQVKSFTTSGNTSRFRIECAPPQQMTGEGEITRLGADAYKGLLKAKGNMQGQPFDMKIAYNGRKIGSCAASENTVTKAKAMAAQQQAQIGQSCQQMAGSMTWQVADQMAASCPTLKADLCKKAKAELNKAGSDPEALRTFQQQRGDWRELASYCGVDAAALQARACTSAKAKKLWGTVAEFCGSEAEALAEAHCSGRSYTVIMTSEYGPLCERFSDKVVVTGGGAKSADAGAAAKLNQAIDGINKLRGLFGR